MIELRDLSRIGFGSYRLSLTDSHYAALRYALSLGCNLIDTASTYTDGQSEELIGKVFVENPQFDAFVITKGGYIQGSAVKILHHLNEKQLPTMDIVSTRDGIEHSIHPYLLNIQIEQSIKRLQRGFVDGFMLHNPEYYFDQIDGEPNDTEYYSRIKKAFEFLEECVSRGILRYYGISSNRFPFATSACGTTNLNTVIDIAKEISSDNHFRLIEFPFNLIEREAIKPHHNGASLLEVAHRNGVVTFGNRPFNVLCNGKSLRLATYEVDEIDQSLQHEVWQNCLKMIANQLDVIGDSGEPEQFEIVALLNSHWNRLESPDAVLSVFQEHLYPLLLNLFKNNIPNDLMQLVRIFYELVLKNTRKSMSEKASVLRMRFVEDGLIDNNDNRSLVVAACESYLNSGIDHVLAGMKRTTYVDDLRCLF